MKARQESAAALSELLNGLTGDISAKLGIAEGSPEKTALHAAVGAIVAKMAGGDVGSGALAGAVSEIANGLVQDLLKANPDLTDAQKASLTQWAAVTVGAAVGGQLGAATALDNVNYNYLNHQDAAALAAARRACASGDQAACQTASDLEAKDAKQQEDYLACRSTGFGADGCGAVLADVTAALSSYSGIAPFTLSNSERLAILDSNGNLDQIIKILAPYGAASLSDDKQRELVTPVNLLTGDFTGITATPAALQEIASGDVTSFAQVLGLLTRNTALKALSKVKGDAGSSAGAPGNAVPDDWRPVSGAGAQVNTPTGFKSYVTADGDIAHVSPAGLIYGYDKSLGNRIDHVLGHTVENPDKSVHTVFNAQGADALALVDQAWLKRGAALANDPRSYVIPMGKVVGTQGETNIKIVVTQVGGNQVTTAYPVP